MLPSCCPELNSGLFQHLLAKYFLSILPSPQCLSQSFVFSRGHCGTCLPAGRFKEQKLQQSNKYNCASLAKHLQCSICSDKSLHSGLTERIKFSFHYLCQFFNCFSLEIASSIVVKLS